MPRRIFVGDVHGHYAGLMSLFEEVAPDSADQVYFVGDLIDRGPQSSQVVDYVRQQGHSCVLGNHERLLLDALATKQGAGQTLHAWLYSGGQSTLNS